MSLATAVGASGAPGATFSHEYLRMKRFVPAFVPPTTMMFPDDSRAIESLAKVPFIAAFVLNVVSAIPAEEYRSSADEVPATIFPTVWIANEIIEVVIVGGYSLYGIGPSLSRDRVIISIING